MRPVPGRRRQGAAGFEQCAQRPPHGGAHRSDGEWALVSSSAVTLEELGAILADPALLPAGLHAERALNLDGGSSTALWVRQPGAEPFSIPEFGIVRDFVGIVARK